MGKGVKNCPNLHKITSEGSKILTFWLHCFGLKQNFIIFSQCIDMKPNLSGFGESRDELENKKCN